MLLKGTELKEKAEYLEKFKVMNKLIRNFINKLDKVKIENSTYFLQSRENVDYNRKIQLEKYRQNGVKYLIIKNYYDFKFDITLEPKEFGEELEHQILFFLNYLYDKSYVSLYCSVTIDDVCYTINDNVTLEELEQYKNLFITLIKEDITTINTKVNEFLEYINNKKELGNV